MGLFTCWKCGSEFSHDPDLGVIARCTNCGSDNDVSNIATHRDPRTPTKNPSLDKRDLELKWAKERATKQSHKIKLDDECFIAWCLKTVGLVQIILSVVAAVVVAQGDYGLNPTPWLGLAVFWSGSVFGLLILGFGTLLQYIRDSIKK